MAFLCLKHHSRYDSSTSQHKNYTIKEVKAARDALYERVADVKVCEWWLVLDARFSSMNKERIEAILDHLRKLLDDPHITIKDIEPGSVRLLVQSSEAARMKIMAILEGEPESSIAGIRVLDVQRSVAVAGAIQEDATPDSGRATTTSSERSLPDESLQIIVEEGHRRLAQYFMLDGCTLDEAEVLASRTIPSFLSRLRDLPDSEHARNRLLERLAADRVKVLYQKTDTLGELVGGVAEPSFKADDALDFVIDLERAMRSLPPRYRAIITLETLGWRRNDIAAAFQMSPGHVSVVVHRARKAMRAFLRGKKEEK